MGMETTEVKEAPASPEDGDLGRLVEVLEELAQAGREVVEAVRSMAEATRRLTAAVLALRDRDPDQGRRRTPAEAGWPVDEPTGWER